MSSIPSPLFHQTLQAPAKLNLCLKFVGRRADGYHLLSMWNVLTTLHDELTIEIFEDNIPSVTVDVMGAPELSRSSTPNIVEKAASQWLRANQRNWRVHCRLQKNIPIGAGLGGGSSDAAAMLMALERLSGSSNNGNLRALALSLGADVPYFLQGGAAWVGGIGEVIQPINVAGLDGSACIVVMPNVSLSTKLMYDAVRGRFPKLPETVENLPVLPPATFSEMLALLENDFEEIAMEISPVVFKVLTALRSERTLAAHMTGSGAALFVLSREDEPVMEIERKVMATLERESVAGVAKCFPVRLLA
jgi:4-diphosphocytidyl-2-C-methyl-D-erythritol kinase